MHLYKHSLFAGILFVILFTVSGCVRAYHVQIDSISDMTAVSSKIYQILPGNKDISATDLQFKEFAGLLVKTMSMQGFVLASAAKHAELEIYLSYGVGDPETHTYSYSTPVWGQTGVDIYTQSSQTNNSDNTGTNQYSITSVQPQYGVTGFASQIGEYTSYKKYIIIDAFNAKNGKPGEKLQEVWKTSIAASGRIKELRKIFPALLAASVKYIGTNTGEEVSVDIPEDSELIKQIKGN
ncbi:MAG: hypothetical protein WCJ94_00570 [bacterium]